MSPLTSLLFIIIVLPSQSYRLTRAHFRHHLHCPDNLHVQLNSIRYAFDQYNCSLTLPHHSASALTRCNEPSSCPVNFPQPTRRPCRTIQFSEILFNYTCTNETPTRLRSQPIILDVKHTMMICLCILLVGLVPAALAIYVRHSPHRTAHADVLHATTNSTGNPADESTSIESTSTMTSWNNKDTITYPSEYDNFIKNSCQLAEPTSGSDPVVVGARLPYRVKFSENC